MCQNSAGPLSKTNKIQPIVIKKNHVHMVQNADCLRASDYKMNKNEQHTWTFEKHASRENFINLQKKQYCYFLMCRFLFELHLLSS